MQLTLHSDIAKDAQKYIRHVHIFYLHHSIPYIPLITLTELTIQIAPHETELVDVRMPVPLSTTIRNTFGRRTDETLASLFINAHYLNLLPDPQPLTQNSLTYKRWPMALPTAQKLTRLASQANLTTPEYLPYILFPQPSQVPIYAKRLVTTYMQLKADLATLNRYSTFYDLSQIIATPPPRTAVGKAGHALDYIMNNNDPSN